MNIFQEFFQVLDLITFKRNCVDNFHLFIVKV